MKSEKHKPGPSKYSLGNQFYKVRGNYRQSEERSAFIEESMIRSKETPGAKYNVKIDITKNRGLSSTFKAGREGERLVLPKKITDP
jgi:hypothetical protein